MFCAGALLGVLQHVELQAFIYMSAVLDVTCLEGNCLILLFMQQY